MELRELGNDRPCHIVLSTDPDAERHLLGFAPVALAAGASTTVQVTASLVPLATWDQATRRRIAPTQPLTLQVGADAGDAARSEIAVAPT